MRRIRAASLAAVLIGLGACARGATGGAALPGATPQPPASRAPLPAPPGLVKAGQLTIGADYHFAPQSYVDPGGHAAGFDVDLAGAIASQMKLKLNVLNIDDPSIIAGLSDPSRRYDMGVNQPNPVVAGAGIPFLPYFASGQAILVRSAEARVKGLDSLCGLSVATAPGSEGDLAVAAVNEAACKSNKVRVVPAPDDVAAAHDLVAGRFDALVDDYPAAVLLARTTSGTKVVPHHAPVTNLDLVFPPGGEPIRDAVSQALDRLKADGTYKRLLNRWGLGEGALK